MDLATPTVTNEQKRRAEPLFNSCVNMAHKIANKFKSKFEGHSNQYIRDEIDAFSMFGLWDAALKYKKSTGNKFSTYAYHYVRGYISTGIKSTLGIKYLTDSGKKTQVRLAFKSADYEDNDDDRLVVRPTITDERSHLAIEATDELNFMRRILTDREWDVLWRCVANGETYGTVGRIHDLSKERVRQIIIKASDILRKGKREERREYKPKDKGVHHIARMNNIPDSTFYAKLKKGWKVDRIVTWHRRLRKKQSRNQIAKDNGVSLVQLKYYTKKGYTLEEAIAKSKESKKRKSRQHVSAERQGNQTAGGKG